MEKRYFALRDELIQRGANITLKDDIVAFRQMIPALLYQDFVPSMQGVAISADGLVQKLQKTPLVSQKWRPD